jgi:ketosteroid isomerase-like protein
MFKLFLLLGAVSALAMGQDDTASLIIRMERAALDRSDRGDVGGFLEISAEDVTYWDPFIDKPVRSLEALRAYYKQFTADDTGKGEMSNAHVQVAGNVAVLTFNYVFRFEKSGKMHRWNTTEVYKKTKEGWRIIHTHWSFSKPEPAK